MPHHSHVHRLVWLVPVWGLLVTQVHAQVQLTHVTPEGDAVVGTPSPELILEFSGAIDPASTAAGTIRLFRTGIEPMTPGPDDTEVSLTEPILEEGDTVVRMSPTEPLADGEYALVVFATPATRSGPGSGLKFSNSAALLDVEAFKTLGEAYTLEAWVRFDNWSSYGSHTYGAIFDVGQRGRYVPGFWLAHVRDEIHFGYYASDDLQAYTVAPGALAKGQWRHIAAVSSASGSAIYVNGELAASMPDTIRPDSISDHIEVALSGYSRWAGAYDFVLGMFDEMRVWNIARTRDDIVRTMYTPLSGQEPGLLVYHPFDQDEGSVLIDETGHAYEGNSNGTPHDVSDAPLMELPGVALVASDGSGIDLFGDGGVGGVRAIPFRVDVTPPRVESLAPDVSECAVVTSLRAIMIGFDDEMDSATLTVGNTTLIAAGGDGAFGDGNETAVVLPEPTYDEAARMLTFRFAEALPDDGYRFTLSDAVQNVAGLALDGEFPSPVDPKSQLPSGDGTPGGAFVVEWTIDSASDCDGNSIADVCELVPGTDFQDTHTIRAFIDGHSRLVIRRNEVYWQHFGPAAAPGRQAAGGGNQPTYIDGAAWYPDWPEPPPAPIGYDAESSVYVDFDPPLPFAASVIQLNVIAARDTLAIYQLPDIDNDYTLIIEFDDPSAEPDWYELELVVSYVSAGDCNENGILDVCEIMDGTAPDCNANNLPDVCDLFENDCNVNGIPDDCEQDCNHNEIPDVCDLSDGTSSDCNGNDIPDECDGGATASALDFDGLGDWVRVPHSSHLEPANELTVEVWIRPDTRGNANNSRIIRTAGASGAGYILSWGQSGTSKLELRIDGAADGACRATDPTPVENYFGTWLHVAGVYSVDAGYCRLYVNGELKADVPAAGTLRYSNSDLYIGNFPGGGESFDGLIDEVRIWDVARTEGELLDSMQHPLLGNEPGLVGYWPFDEGSGQYAIDSSPYAQDGVLGSDASSAGDGRDPVWVKTVAPLLYRDCNENGTLDECDIADGTSNDCNENGTPDECEPAEDCNNNGVQDICDLAAATSADCNEDGIPDDCQLADNDCDGNSVPDDCEDCNRNGLGDSCDLAAGTSDDCDENGVPDECEPDCNGNEVVDICDIRDGTSFDFDDNGVPDECQPDCNDNGLPDFLELMLGFSSDCNENDVPDDCDLSEQTSADCNGNAVPDECDVRDGYSEDCDGDSVPDSCEPDADGDGIPNDCDAFGDFDHDADVDLADFGVLWICLDLSGPVTVPPFRECLEAFDASASDTVDLRDVAAFQRAFRGPR